MEKKTRKSGIKGYIITFIWLIIFIGFCLAVIKINNYNSPLQLWDWAYIKAQELNACINESVETETIKCNLSLKVHDYNKQDNKQKDKEDNQTQDIKEINKKEQVKEKTEDIDINKLKKELQRIKTIDNYNGDYNRKDYKHWENITDCWNKREDILYNRGKNVIFLDKNKNETKNINKACYIKSGEWKDFYTNEVITDIGEIDIDHVVPLKIANNSGGNIWVSKIKKQFANDEDNLVITSAKNNRSKQSKSPSKWLPKNECGYIKTYINIINKYHLDITKEDIIIINKILNKCERDS